MAEPVPTTNRALSGGEAVALVTLLADAEIRCWVEGGWGVDALVGAQHRDHGDLDLVIELSDAPRVVDLLHEAGFEEIFEELPAKRSLAHPDGRVVDLTMVHADPAGDRWTADRPLGRGQPDYPADGLTYGWIVGARVDCLGPQVQVEHHTGYPSEPVDHFDVELLHQHFSVVVPASLQQG